MTKQDLILIDTICSKYEIDVDFMQSLDDIGLINILTIEQSNFIPIDRINDLEKIIRLNNDLQINLEGIDIIFNLLDKVDKLENELATINKRLKLYEDDIEY